MPCSAPDYYAVAKCAQLEQQIYYLKSVIGSYIQSSCINPAFSLINYTTSITNPSLDDNFQVGSITYYQTVITNSFNGDRIWTFTMGGAITKPAFWIVYQFDPNCFVPNGFDFSRLNNINFYKTGVDAKAGSDVKEDYEPLQGTIIVGNINISVSEAYSAFNIEWYPSTGELIFKFNIFAIQFIQGYQVQYQQLQRLVFSDDTPQSFYINLTIRDALTDGTAVTSASYFGNIVSAGDYMASSTPTPTPTPAPTPAPTPTPTPVI